MCLTASGRTFRPRKKAMAVASGGRSTTLPRSGSGGVDGGSNLHAPTVSSAARAALSRTGSPSLRRRVTGSPNLNRSRRLGSNPDDLGGPAKDVRI